MDAIKNLRGYINSYFNTPNGQRQLNKADYRDKQTGEFIRKDSSLAVALYKAAQ